MFRRLAAAAAVALVASTVLVAQPARRAGVTIQLLALNDFHGSLEPPTGGNGRVGSVITGGAAYLATHLKRAIADNPNSLVVASGDVIGASPLISSLVHNEPAIESLNAMHLSVSSIGNHEFDGGWQELVRMQKGGCHPTDGCQPIIASLERRSSTSRRTWSARRRTARCRCFLRRRCEQSRA